VVGLAASWVAGMTAWLLVTAPTTTALAVQGGDAERLMQLALTTFRQLLAQVARYL
jgi:hypothetical protein